VGEAPAWVVRTAFAIWTAGILSLGGTLCRMTELLRRAEKIPVQETSLA
jgi:hypothetical protein